MKIFDTKSAKLQEFEPIVEGKIGMYVCGPTVYDNAHLGHGRSAVCFDLIRRYFLYKGYEVKYVSNYTDIDDKMINRANEEGISVEDLANRIIPEYEKDYDSLGVMVPTVKPKATEYVEEMIELINRLEKDGYTYVLDDGVYYDVTKFAAYGQLSKQDLESLQMGARVEVKESKRSPHDFVLWKFKKEGEPFWESSWGDGRPGWHIECSAMTWKNLGEKFDVHGGGLDLTFPHHECEIAQSVGVFGKGSFAKYWMHNGFINVDNEKMSKSLGNFFTLKDVFTKYDPKVVRFMFLQTHYRNPINFSDALLDQAKAGLGRVHDFVRSVEAFKIHGIESDPEVEKEISIFVNKAVVDFEFSMDDDFDSSGGLAALFDFIKAVNVLSVEKKLSLPAIDLILNFLQKLDSVLGVIFVKAGSLDSEVENLIEEREKARSEKDFAKSDEIRDILLERGIVLEDTPNGTIWKRA